MCKIKTNTIEKLTDKGKAAVKKLAEQHEISVDSVITLLYAIVRGGGTMAQFDIRELGGSGQWMKGGMIMVGDMFNASLKAKVEQLCNQLSLLIGSKDLFIDEKPENRTEFRMADNWWPDGLGAPSSSGSQNDLRYAFFPQTQRLVINQNGHTVVYDTLDHHISGVSQQQGNDQSIIFTSQHGRIHLEQLPKVNRPGADTPTAADKEPTTMEMEAQRDEDPRSVIKLLEQLSHLHKSGILTDEEYSAKKAELLKRI